MKQTLCTILVSITLASGASAAQTTGLQGRLHRSSPPNPGTYNLTTGFELGVTNYRSGPETIFDNSDGYTYYFGDMQHQTEEWIDSFAFAADELSGTEQINGFRYEYCSSLSDPLGNAITTEVRFYEDHPLFAEPTGWTDPVAGTIQNSACAYILTGLPGDTTSLGVECWAITVDLMCGFECTLPQELTPGGFTEYNGIGWMYMAAGAIGLTGPMLQGTVTAAGPGTAVPGYGTTDLLTLMDLADVGNEFQGSFWFGGAPKAHAIFTLTLYGDGIPDTDVVNADAPDLDDVLCLGSDTEFRTGNAVTWTLDDQGGTAIFPSSAYAMLVGTHGSSAGFGGLAGAGTTLLVDPGSLLIPPTPLVMSGVVPAVTTPSLPGLPPTIWAQAFGFNGGIGPGNAAEASNALRHNN